MNKRKLVFGIIGIAVLVLTIGLISILNSKSAKKVNSGKGNLSIWIIGDDSAKFNEVLNDFKEKFPKYKNNNFNIVSFSNYEDYYHSLVGAFLTGKAPDIFSLNNNDSNFFESQIMGIDPLLINPDDFRKNYEGVFSNDLIRKTKIDGKEVEFLIGIPLGYEVLGLFYNFREIKGKKLTTWSYINDIIRQLSEEDGKVGIGIGNGTTVYNSEDIITQFLLLDGIEKISDANGDKLKVSISNYIRFGDENMENKYNKFYSDTIGSRKNNLDLFSEGSVQMVLGYPRIIEQIDKNGFNKNFLRAESFPTYIENKGKLLVNYNYFVINKNTNHQELALDIIRYLGSQDGQKKYLEKFSYYLPSMLSLLNDRLEENIKDGYVIKYKDFYNKDLELTSFNKGIKAIYDKEVPLILDSGPSSADLFGTLGRKLSCISSKMVTGMGLENPCR